MPTKNYDIQGFDRIRISGAFEFDITRGDNFKVALTSDPLKVIEVSREGDTLRIAVAWYSYLWSFLTWWTHPRAVVALPELRELRISGASHGEAGDFATTHDFSAELVGASGLRLGSISASNIKLGVKSASQLEFGKLKGTKADIDVMGASRIKGEMEIAGDISLDVMGASRVELSGSAGDACYNFRGASQAQLDNFSIHNAKVKAYGASNVVFKVDGRLDVEAFGASHVNWAGNPTMGDVRSGGASTLGKA